ncbi:hypothetical protein GH5_05631 [Leishmania sp. Ghana 2012 LV757]|uniref:hypothetical protein n=1 Tax=Leishmania sp. Ghana 2012 LV757 TaxID=2803181 RepID=UPI001B6E4661|nr:hypothetical protein GH5_05631 [Leishmania sp. Ghana 2012 LV757]
MVSRWKRVDLLSLSSVTAARRRRQPQRSVPITQSFGFQASSTCTTLDPRMGANGPTSSRPFEHPVAHTATTGASSPTDACAARHDSIDTTVGSFAPSAARVPPSAAAAATAIRVSISRLLCCSSLPWHCAVECFCKLAEGERRRRAASTTSRDTHRPQSGDCVMPLEAIVAVYGMLLRRQASQTTAGNAEHGNGSSLSTAEATATRPPSGDTSPPCGVSVSPLAFLAYASQQHSGLNPIAALLGADRGYGVDDAPEPPCSRGVHENAHGGVPPLPLLSVSTILHLGLLKELQIASAPPSSLAAAPAAGAAPTTAQASLTLQWWAAVQTIHHMQCYGWAPDYLRALAETPPPAAAPSASATWVVGDWRGESAGRVCNALAQVQSAAHGMPYFTHLLCAVEDAWARHSERRCYLTSEQPPPPVEEDGDSQALPSNMRRQRTASPLAGGTPSREVSVFSDEASAAMACAIGATATRKRLKPATATSDAVHHEILSMSTKQLLAVTRDLVVFAWRAMGVRRRRTVGAAGAHGNHAAIPYGSALQGTTSGGPGGEPSAVDSVHCRQMGSSAVIVDEEQDALLRVVRTAARFSEFDDLNAWMKQLFAPDDRPVFSEMSDSPPRSPVLSPQREEALLCLLTWAVRRAPSWSATCTLLSHTWPKLPCVSAAAGVARTAMRCRRDDGVGSVPELLEAFFTSPHAPTGSTPSQVTSLAVFRPAITDACFWYRVIVCNDTTDAEVAHWKNIMFGSDTFLSSTGLPADKGTEAMVRRHDALTRAALLVVHRWLLPADALGVALQCLARSHARCAEQWAAVLERRHIDRKGDGANADHRCRKDGKAEVARARHPFPRQRSVIASVCSATAATPTEGAAGAVPAAVTRLMADQHRAYCGALLSTQEQLEWLDVTLRCTPSGSARQLVIKAALVARWHGGPDTVSVREGTSDGGVGDGERAMRARSAANQPISAAVADLATITNRWIAQAEVELEESSAAAALFNRGDDLLPSAALFADVGRLLADMSSALNSLPGGPSAVEMLFAEARAAVTAVGLSLERDVPPLRPSLLFSTQATAAEVVSAGLPAWQGDSVAAGPALSRSARAPERHSRKGVKRRLARLHSWLELLCTSPVALLVDEQCVVLWLYVLMRQVEEMHEYARENSANLSEPHRQRGKVTPQAENAVASCRAGASFGGGDADGGECQWSLEAEEAAVRRVAQSLSSRLWSVLPTSSLLPPMLLNWLLTRGGERTWGDAVRTLRAAAEAGGGITAGHTERRFSLLVLPLDRVVSVEHAVRLLCTLQAVEERYAAAAATTEAAPLQRTPARYANPQERPRCRWISSVSAVAQLKAEPVSLATVRERRNRQPPDATTLAGMYRQIERVVLLEWYGRALAAVLLFFSRQPQHTYLTYVKDASHHAALSLRRWQGVRRRAPDLLGPEGGGGRAKMAAATRSVGTEWASQATRPSLHPSSGPQGAERSRAFGVHGFVAATSHAEASLKRWRAWMDGTVAAAKAGQGSLLPPATTLPANATVPTDAAAVVASERVQSIDGLNSAATGAILDSASFCEVRQAVLHEGASPSVAAAPSAAGIRVPLHLLATFILQESRIRGKQSRLSVNCAASAVVREDSIVNARWQPKRRFPLAALRSPFSSSLSSVLYLDVLAREARRLVPRQDFRSTFTRRDEASAPASLSQPEGRTVSPELLVLFSQVLQLKQRDAVALSGAAAAEEETIEEVAAAVLAERCAASATELCAAAGAADEARESASQRHASVEERLAGAEAQATEGMPRVAETQRPVEEAEADYTKPKKIEVSEEVANCGAR